jgi:predicted site-specific integrase-resolvase
MEAQLVRLVVYAHNRRSTIAQAVCEVGLGLNGHRPKPIKLPTRTFRRLVQI